MARKGSPDVGFALFDGRSILSTLTEVDIGREVVLEDNTVLGDADEAWAPVGLKRGTLSQRGFFDDAANSVHDHLVALVQRTAAIALEGNTIGKKFIGWAGAITTKYRRIASKGTLHKAEADYTVTGPVEEGIILHAHTQETAAGNTEGASSVDNLASSANGGAGYAEVSQLTLGGYTNVALKIRHSADDITYADLIAFTVVTAAPTGERKTVAGTVNRHLASSWAYGGAGAGQSVTFVVGFARG